MGSTTRCLRRSHSRWILSLDVLVVKTRRTRWERFGLPSRRRAILRRLKVQIVKKKARVKNQRKGKEKEVHKLMLEKMLMLQQAQKKKRKTSQYQKMAKKRKVIRMSRWIKCKV